MTYSPQDGPMTETWADGFGRWYALVPNGPAPLIQRAMALGAIDHELVSRNGAGFSPALPESVERVPMYDSRDRTAFREAI